MEKLFNLYVDNLKRTVDLIPTIQNEVKKFDGKVYNKRFENAVLESINIGRKPEETIYFRVSDFDYKRCYLTLNFYNYHSVSEGGRNYYLPSSYDTVQICNLCTDYNIWDTSKNEKYHERNESFFWIDSNYKTRLNTSAIVKGLEDERQKILERIKELTEKASRVAEYKARFEKIKADLKDLQEEVPYQIQDIFDLQMYANWS